MSAGKGHIKSGAQACCSAVFGYETQKIVQISSVKVGIIYRLIQILIIAYIIGWVMIYKKGYQDFEPVVSGVVSKVKGVCRTEGNNRRVWDVADYVVPPQEKDALFITTRAIITDQQVQGKCAEDPTVPGAWCQSNADCPKDEPLMLGNGVRTGKCVETQFLNGTMTQACEIYAWCPVEMEGSDSSVLTNVENFTLLIKNSVEFPKFKIKRSNVIQPGKINNCHYDPNKDPDCPVMFVQTILQQANTQFKDINRKGGVISININWNCDFDYSQDMCKPKYSFRRLDDETSDQGSGWNFRYANFYNQNDTQYRSLVKAYGIRILIYVTGQGGKFNFVPLTMNLGSGLALLGVATLLCDMVVLYLLNRKNIYRDAKYETIVEDDAFKISTFVPPPLDLAHKPFFASFSALQKSRSKRKDLWESSSSCCKNLRDHYKSNQQIMAALIPSEIEMASSTVKVPKIVVFPPTDNPSSHDRRRTL